MKRSLKIVLSICGVIALAFGVFLIVLAVRKGSMLNYLSDRNGVDIFGWSPQPIELQSRSHMLTKFAYNPSIISFSNPISNPTRDHFADVSVPVRNLTNDETHNGVYEIFSLRISPRGLGTMFTRVSQGIVSTAGESSTLIIEKLNGKMIRQSHIRIVHRKGDFVGCVEDVRLWQIKTSGNDERDTICLVGNLNYKYVGKITEQSPHTPSNTMVILTCKRNASGVFVCCNAARVLPHPDLKYSPDRPQKNWVTLPDRDNADMMYIMPSINPPIVLGIHKTTLNIVPKVTSVIKSPAKQPSWQTVTAEMVFKGNARDISYLKLSSGIRGSSQLLYYAPKHLLFAIGHTKNVERGIFHVVYAISADHPYTFLGSSSEWCFDRGNTKYDIPNLIEFAAGMAYSDLECSRVRITYGVMNTTSWIVEVPVKKLLDSIHFKSS